MSNDRNLIVKKNHGLTNPDAGILDIVFVSSNDDKSVELPSSSEFPTGGIFFSRGYERLITQFKDGELFRLIEWYQDQDQNYSDGRDGKHPHWAKSSSVQLIEASAFIPIYKGKLPDISTGYVDIPNLPVNKAFFIRDLEKIYGPFTASARSSDDGVKVLPYSQPILSIPHNHILKLHSEALQTAGIITPFVNDEIPQYITSLRALSTVSKGIKEEVDFISDEQLIAYFAKSKFGKKTILSKKEAEKLKSAVAEYINKGKLAKSERVTRLNDILDKYLKADGGDELVKDYLNSEKGKEFLNDYVETKPDILTKATEQIEIAIEAQEERLRQTKNDAQSQIKVQKERVEAEKSRAATEVEKIKKDAEEKISKIREKSQADWQREREEALGDLQTEIIGLEKQKKEISASVEQFYLEQDEVKCVKDLEERTTYLETHRKMLEKAVSAQSSLLRNPELVGIVTEVNTVIDMLQGRSLNQKDDEYKFNAPKIIETDPDDPRQYIQTLVEFFENDGHSISFSEIANLLINIQQSFLTVLAGLPGSGKTSSITRLSNAQGLCPQEENNSDCFLNVPVARGWVSSRDFVGFNNSLKGVFQPAKTGVYQFLRQGEQSEAEDFLRMILLDEANLSPIEHYWSEFLGMCDREGRSRPIDTGIQSDKRFLYVKNNIRFVATINNDNTTEPLSPRLCDRVPVIMMDVLHIDSAEQVASLSLNGAIKYSLLNEWFGLPPDSEQELPPLIKEFCATMILKKPEWGSEIYISQRKLNAMAAYCAKAGEYIGSFVAIDFALSQHALPLISGHGKEFRQRLECLEELAINNNLDRTSILLKKILEAGETYIDSYSFF
ncbi:MAG: hypothetical protein GXO85_06230 [Chlorobi bacterium]|nr:hypothetical protein [Chlorobiota bacterium]